MIALRLLEEAWEKERAKVQAILVFYLPLNLFF